MKSLYLFRFSILMAVLLGWNLSSIAQTTVFNYTGSVQSFSVVAGVFSVSVDCRGGKGGNDNQGYGTGGSGGRVQCQLATTPGTILWVYVGNVGSGGISSSSGAPGGWNGGGNCVYYYGGAGGGASDIRVGGTTLANRVVVAGGGGGSGYCCSGTNGGAGGYPSGGSGNYSGAYSSTYCGAGGSQTAGGAGSSLGGVSGSLGQGGNSYEYGGGGGGGYYGGGGAGYYGGAGGGSNYNDPVQCTSVTQTSGFNAAAGQITLIGNCTPPTNGVLTGNLSVCGIGLNTPLGTTASPGGNWTSSNTAVATISNTGVVSGVSIGSTTISYFVTYACGTAYATGVFNVNAIPTPPFPTGPSLTMCAGSSITLNDVTPGGSWVSGNTYSATVNSTTGVVTGVSAGNPVISYVVIGSGCYSTTAVVVNPTPIGISGTPVVCASGGTTTLSDITPGGVWNTSNGSIATVTSLGLVTGAANGTTNINYTLPSTGCSVSIPVVVNPLPTTVSLNVTGGGGYCPGASGVPIILSGTTTAGVNYQLYNGTTPVGGAQPGGTGSINFGLQTVPGTYSVIGKYATTGCSKTMLSSAQPVSIYPLPNVYPVTIQDGGYYCSGTGGVDFQLTNSDNGVLYRLFYNGALSSQYITVLGSSGTAIDFANESVTGLYSPLTDSGTYTVLGIDATTDCAVFMSGSGTVTINQLPAIQNVIGGGSYCAGGAGVHIKLDNSEPGISYQLFNSAPAAVGLPLMGTLAELDFGSITNADVYSITATNVLTGCTQVMTNTPSVSITSLPTVYPVTVSNGGIICAGQPGDEIYIPTSDFGTNYQLMSGTTMIGIPVSGDGDTAFFGSFAASGSYNVVATDGVTGCQSTMAGPGVIRVNPVPANQTITGGGSYCSGGAGVPLNLGGSEMNVTYVLNYNGAMTTTSVTGTGGAITFGMLTDSGSYTVSAMNNITSCASNLAGGVNVLVNQLPQVHNVIGGGSYCAGMPGVHVDLDFSDLGVNYQLWNGSISYPALLGSGTELDFGSITTAGTYTVKAVNVATGCTNTMAGSAPVSMNPLPTAYSVTGGGSFCAGASGLNVGLAHSASGINYQLFNSGVPGALMSGTGTALNYGLMTNPGVYTIVATNPSTGCTNNMAGVANISVNPLPVAYPVTGGGNFCAGGSGVHVGLASTNTGVSYQLSNGTGAVGLPVTGTGGAVDFGVYSGSGVYTVYAVNTTTGCNNNMGGSASIVVNPLPVAHNVTGGGSYCEGGLGVHVGVNVSETGVNYQLYNGTAMEGSYIGGLAGAAIDFGPVTMAGTYWVAATNSLTGCKNNMAGSAVVVVNSLPAVYTVTGGGVYCEGSTGVHVGLSGSVGGFSYQLMNGGTGSGTALAGNGTVLDFGVQANSGNYTVLATNNATGCTNNMASSAEVTVNPQPAPYALTGGGNYCEGGVGQAIGLIGSVYGVNYQLFLGSTMVDLPIGGTGSALNFGLQTGAGVYTIVATNVVTGCTNNMPGSETISIIPSVVPAVTVSASPATTVCNGTAATFTATGVNGGSSPTYQWFVGTTSMGSGTSYSYIPSNGDVVKAVMTSNATCPSISTVNNAVTMNVINYVLPSATISSSATTPSICPNTNVTYTATTVYGGNSPVYNWLVNNVNVGTGTTYTYQPMNNDVVNFMLVSDQVCASIDSVFSNDFVMNVITPIVPVFTINSHLGQVIGVGVSDTLRAVVTNGGISELSYQWFVNGYPVHGATLPRFVADTVFNGDVITCTVTSFGQCGGGSTTEGVTIDLTNLAVNSVNSYGSAVKVSPNPNNGSFSILGSLGTTLDEEVTIQITNMIGQEVYNNKVMAIGGNLNEKIQLSNAVTSGNYILNIHSASGSSIYHVVIAQ